MKTAVLGLGTNIGEREENLKTALESLDRVPGTKVVKTSGIHETEPVGYADQPDFLNMCAVVETALSPEALLGACLGIEAAMGRLRPFKNGPRVIDIDLLLYEGEKRDTDELTLPHPRMWEREFVTVPLAELGLDLSRFTAD